MTRRLYYHDAYLTRFTARAVAHQTHQGHPAVVLDRTAFYPTSGGQPFDTGTLDGVPVVEVVERQEDGAVLHVLAAPLPESERELVGEIDWERRFDHMQHHTGQHILSQSFLQVAQAETVGFHMSDRTVTIDLSAPQPLTEGVMEQVEALSNQIVWQDRPVTVQVVPPEALGEVPLRKPPPVRGEVRIVQVQGFDWSACGGTHVARTGQIGLIKIVRWERRGADTRITFCCGERARRDYGAKNRMLAQVSDGFNVGYWELDQAVARLRDENKALRSQLREAGRALTRYRAAELVENGIPAGGVRLVTHRLPDETLVPLQALARQLTSRPGVVALLGTTSPAPQGFKARLCFARSADVDLDVVPLLREAAQALGGRGGGQPTLAQGGGTASHPEQVDDLLSRIAQKLYAALEPENYGNHR